MHVGESANKKSVLEELLDLGMVLVALDARVQGVDVPGHLGRDPQLRLNLSFRFGLPMSLDPWGIKATLTFGGVPYACRFPWKAIYLLVSHVNGEPYLFPDEVPAELLAQVGVESAWSIQPSAKPKPAPRPKFRLVRPDEGEDEAQADADADATPADPASARGDAADGADVDADETKAPAAPAPIPAKARGRGGRASKAQPARPAAVPDPQPKPAGDKPSAAGAGEDDTPPDAPPPSDDGKRRRGHLRLIK